MEINKSKGKLKGIPPVRYINLDGQPERAKYMEDQFEYWGVENFKRVSANDGRDDDLSHLLKGRYPDNMNPCLLYTSPSPRDLSTSRMPSSA